MQQVVTKPVVAIRVVESDFELYPRTIKEVGPIGILVNKQRNAVSYKDNRLK